MSSLINSNRKEDVKPLKSATLADLEQKKLMNNQKKKLKKNQLTRDIKQR